MVSGRRTVPAMEHRPTDEMIVMNCHSRKGWTFLLMALFGLLFLLQPQLSYAQDKNLVLPESGIHYPTGFDENTVGVVKGRAYEFVQPERGPVQFRLDTGRENYTVIASPPWYWSDLKVKMPEGTEVEVRGSKSLGKDGKLYIIGQEMKVLATDKVYSFRDESGYPLWRGGQSGARKGAVGGFGSHQNGFFRGIGGMGRGRR